MLDPAILAAYASKTSATPAEAEAEIHRVVCEVASKFAGRAFGSHTRDDVVQTCVAHGLEALSEGTRYDPARPLPQFLYAYMRNQLYNAMRSQASRRESPCACCSATDPPAEPCRRFRAYRRANDFRKSLAKVASAAGVADQIATPDQIVLARELDAYIRTRLDSRWLGDFERMKVDDPPKGARLRQLREAVREILEGSPYGEMLPPTPPSRDRQTLTWEGRTRTLAEWAETTGLNVSTLHWRVSHGWSAERVLSEPAGPARRRSNRLPAPKREPSEIESRGRER